MSAITLLPVNEGGFVIQGEGVITDASTDAEKIIELDSVERLYTLNVAIMAAGFDPTDPDTHTSSTAEYQVYVSNHSKARVLAGTAMEFPLAASNFTGSISRSFYGAYRSLRLHRVSGPGGLWVTINGK